jgi:hypothetical protein
LPDDESGLWEELCVPAKQKCVLIIAILLAAAAGMLACLEAAPAPRPRTGDRKDDKVYITFRLRDEPSGVPVGEWVDLKEADASPIDVFKWIPTGNRYLEEGYYLVLHRDGCCTKMSRADFVARIVPQQAAQ